MNSISQDFLKRHGVMPGSFNPCEVAETMREHMIQGLNGNIIDMPMIPTYLRSDGELPLGKKAVVIDAGGTNYRCALAEFNEEGCIITNLKKSSMPGTGSPVSWEEFISFVADSIEPLLTEADVIGFCFSYNVEITPEIDGIVNRVDKEVVIKDSSGKHLGASLIAMLEKRGIYGKKVVILNDTVAALFGGMSSLKRYEYSGFAGMICGTGVNTCTAVPVSSIGKLDIQTEGNMLINLESGLFNGIPQGDIDVLVDRESNNPGEKIMEKMSSGAYLGIICRAELNAAVEEGILPGNIPEALDGIQKIDGSVVDEWANGNDSHGIFSRKDMEFVSEICRAILQRSAACMCTNIIALMLLTDSGKTPEKPMCICAEGSLISYSHEFRKTLLELLDRYAVGEMKRYCRIAVGRDTTLPGSAFAVLLNT